MKHLRITTIVVCVFVVIGIQQTHAGDDNKTSWIRGLRFKFDDGNVMEEIDPSQNIDQIEQVDDPTLKIESKEKGTHEFGRRLIKPFINAAASVASGAASRISKAFNFVTHTTGLDTNSSFFSGPADSFKHHIKAIYPGTRWCGDGDKAKSDDDLGTFEDTDKCCRAHDKCFEFIPAGETKFGLHNTGLFTRSHCDCDNEFYSCLKNSTDMIARKIGFTYFSILGPQCFREDYFVSGCIHYSRGKCIEYRSDPTKGKLFQWFDSPLFI